nr:hypothetical protein [Tanacetum cinerariifolium]
LGVLVLVGESGESSGEWVAVVRMGEKGDVSLAGMVE